MKPEFSMSIVTPKNVFKSEFTSKKTIIDSSIIENMRSSAAA